MAARGEHSAGRAQAHRSACDRHRYRGRSERARQDRPRLLRVRRRGDVMPKDWKGALVRRTGQAAIYFQYKDPSWVQRASPYLGNKPEDEGLAKGPMAP